MNRLSITAVSIFACALLLLSCKKEKNEILTGKNIGSLYISKAKPVPGDSLHFFYNPENLTSNSNDKVEGIYHIIVNDKAYPVDLELNDSLQGYGGKIAIPDSAMALILHLKVNEEPINNERKGFVLPMYNKEGIPVKGADASIGYFYLTRGEEYGMEMNKDSALAMIEKDLESFPKLKEHWEKSYRDVLLENNYEKGKLYFNDKIALLEKKDKLTADEYQTLAELYGYLRRTKESDSIRAYAAEKFPKSRVARLHYFYKFLREPDFEKKKEIFNFYNENVAREGGEKNFMIDIIAPSYAREGNLNGFQELANQIQDDLRKANLYNQIAKEMTEENKDLEKAAELSRESFRLLDQLKKDKYSKPHTLTEKQYQRNLQSSDNLFSGTYAAILFKKGELKEAIKYQKKAAEEENSPELNERLVQYLIADNNYTEAQNVAEKFVRNDVATGKVKEFLKTAYIKNMGSAQGFDNYQKALEEQAYQNTLAVLKKKMKNAEAPNFILKNFEGENVSLASFKGKTVVLDFWATWCGPCKAAFPGMQIAVDKYKEDPNVEFLFIATMESGNPEERKKKTSEFIAEKNYDFNVLLDYPETEGANDFVTARNYEVEGIPAKIIIGPEGKIKFVSVGYSGNNDKMVRELEMMIKLARA